MHIPDVKKIFAALHARTFVHATEDPDKVMMALLNAIGRVDVKTSKTEGQHGNPILILEATLDGMEDIVDFFERLGDDDLTTLEKTTDSRIDDGCNLFMRIDKQAALKGDIRLAGGEDVISIRVKVVAYPSRCDIALKTVRAFIDGERSRRNAI